MWITNKAIIEQDDINYIYTTLTNELYQDYDGTIYISPRKLITDNYTMPLGINKCKYDIRPSHIHDIGCRYHQLIKVNLSLKQIQDKYLYRDNNEVYCKDIPKEYLEVVNVTGNFINNLFYRMMVSCGIKKNICRLYRVGVAFNLSWFSTGKIHIDLNKIYKENT